MTTHPVLPLMVFSAIVLLWTGMPSAGHSNAKKQNGIEIRRLHKSPVFNGPVTANTISRPITHAPYGPVDFTGRLEVGINKLHQGRWRPVKPVTFSGTVSIRALSRGMAYGVRMRSLNNEDVSLEFDLASAVKITKEGQQSGAPNIRIIDGPGGDHEQMVQEQLKQVLNGLNRFPNGPVAPGDNLMPHAAERIAGMPGTATLTCLYQGTVTIRTRTGALCQMHGKVQSNGQSLSISGYSVFDIATGASMASEILFDTDADSNIPQFFTTYKIVNPDLL